MSRLTDEQIDGMALWAQEDFTDGRMHACAMLLVPMAAIELQERRAKDIIHSQSHCLDCEGPLVPCDCQPDCPGAMCARECWKDQRAMEARREARERAAADLTAEEREALDEIRRTVGPSDYGLPGMVSPAALSILDRLLSQKAGG